MSTAADDLIMDVGEGDAIRFVGGGDLFDCDDAAYENVQKVVQWTMLFDDGSALSLCALKNAEPVPIDVPLAAPEDQSQPVPATSPQDTER